MPGGANSDTLLMGSTSRSAAVSSFSHTTRSSSSTYQPAPELERDPVVVDLQGSYQIAAAKLREVLKKQKGIADDLHVIVGDPANGLQFHTERTRRNLMAAISVARQMGYFKLYETPVDTVRIEKGGVVGTRVKEIRALQVEADSLTAEMKRIEAALKAHTSRPPPPINTLQGWFAAYGDPRKGDAATMGRSKVFTPGYASQFKPSTHRYGATKLFPASVSMSTKLIVGRALK
jgi:hypothetical protein